MTCFFVFTDFYLIVFCLIGDLVDANADAEIGCVVGRVFNNCGDCTFMWGPLVSLSDALRTLSNLALKYLESTGCYRDRGDPIWLLESEKGVCNMDYRLAFGWLG